MSATGEINAINLSFYAEDAAARDKANGSYTANFKADSRYYQWQGEQQLVPMGLNGDAAGYVAAMRTAMPVVNTLRLQFNAFSFNKDGSLHKDYEAFLVASAKAGYKIIMTYSDGEMQQLGRGDGLTSKQVLAKMTSSVEERATQSWSKMMGWMSDHSSVKAAVYGYEVANEAAGYDTSAKLAPWGQKAPARADAMKAYVEHMVEVAKIIGQTDANAKVLVGGWGFSGTFEEFTGTKVGRITALDYLHKALGDKLVWSAHIYPGWHSGNKVSSAAEIVKAIDAAFAPLGKDNIIVTETNLSGDEINDLKDPSVVHYFSRAMEYFAENGIGIGWFPGVGAGAASFVSIDAGNTMRFLHQYSYAFGMHAFSLDDHPATHRGDEVIQAKLVNGLLRNELSDSSIGTLNNDSARKLGTAFGYDGNDRLVGHAAANNFLYGGSGQDRLIGARYDDFLFGQSGDDVLHGAAGSDLLMAGSGRDLLMAGSGSDTLEGGTGADRFDASSGNDLITDFTVRDGDRVYLGHGYTTWGQVAARISYAAINGTAKDDVVIRHKDGTTTTLLDAKSDVGAQMIAFETRAQRVEGTSYSDIIAVGYEDFGGAIFGTNSRKVMAGSGNDLVKGSALTDKIWLGGGNDKALGGAGNDKLWGDAGRDILRGGAGNDVIHLGGGKDKGFGGAGHDKIWGDGGRDVVKGGGGRDAIHLGGGKDKGFGGAGNDKIWGDGGNDKVFGGGGRDKIHLGGGNDKAFGGAGNDKIWGDLGADKIHGGAGNDKLYSGAGRGHLWGDAGDDLLVADLRSSGQVLTGGAGDDHFVFVRSDRGERTHSIITDFKIAQDSLTYKGHDINLRQLAHGMSGENTKDGFVLVMQTGHDVLLDGFFL